MNERRKRARAAAAVLLVAAIFVAGCGDDGDSGTTAASTTGNAATPTTSMAPVKGGTLNIGVFSEIRGLDPIISPAPASGGGLELGAIYDRLVVWNPDTKKYDPQTAESVTPNADLSEWTIKLKTGIKFGDGTAYDAAALKFNFDRQKKENTFIAGPMGNVKETTVVDALTAKVTLTEPWGGFPFLLSNSLGMLVSPTALQTLGKDALQLNPVGAGAGPFEIASFKKGESITLKKKANYWGGEVNLDGLKFVALVGGAATYDALKTGGLDVAFFREAATVAQSRDDGYAGYENVLTLGELFIINNGVEVTCQGAQPAPLCTGKTDGTKIATVTPGKDPDVRRAIQAATDLVALDQRANEGKGLPSGNLFDKSFPWDPKVPGPKYNVDEAKKLVAAAKSRGWDGKIRLICNSAPARQNATLALEAMLKNVGIDVATTIVPDVQLVVTDVIVNKNFDIACWGTSASPDDGAQSQLDSFLRSTSGSNRVGYKSAAMDAALSDLKKASTDDAKVAAFKKIAETWNADIPSLATSALAERIVWSKKVHDVRKTSLTNLVFDKAWIEK